MSYLFHHSAPIVGNRIQGGIWCTPYPSLYHSSRFLWLFPHNLIMVCSSRIQKNYIPPDHIQGAFYSSFPDLLGFGFHRKFARTKNQQDIDKASEHNGAYSISLGFFLSFVQIKGSADNFLLSSLCFTSTQYAITSIFAFATASNQLPF